MAHQWTPEDRRIAREQYNVDLDAAWDCPAKEHPPQSLEYKNLRLQDELRQAEAIYGAALASQCKDRDLIVLQQEQIALLESEKKKWQSLYRQLMLILAATALAALYFACERGAEQHGVTSYQANHN